MTLKHLFESKDKNMVYKIASIHPGTDEFRYYNSKEDAKKDVSCVSIERRPGSKGANCAIALSKKGARVDYFTVGNGAYGCDSFLSDEKIRIIRTVTSAQERINVKLIYPCGEINGMIEKNGKMDALSTDEKQRFFDSLTACASVGDKNDRTFIFTGSLPTGVENEEYLRCISHLSSLGEYVVLDGRGSLISAQRENFASLIKPNRDEFIEMSQNVDILKSFKPPVDKSPDFFNEYLGYALKYVEKYGSEVLLTLGEAGLVYASSDAHFIKKAVPKKLAYPAGAGDRLLSSFLYFRRSEGANINEALDRAMLDAVGESESSKAQTSTDSDNKKV